MEATVFIKIVLITVLIVISLFLGKAYFQSTLTKNTFKLASFWLLAVLVLFTFISRWVNMVNVEPNIDTSTWIVSTLSIKMLPDKMWLILNYTDSRPLTVLPLYLVSLMGIPINYVSSEIIGLIFWIFSGLTLYKTFQLFLSTELSLLLSWLLLIVISTTWHFDHIAYNSEHLGILTITLCTYWYLKIEKYGNVTFLKTILIGLCLGTLPYI